MSRQHFAAGDADLLKDHSRAISASHLLDFRHDALVNFRLWRSPMLSLDPNF
ncbi:hypothetical protein AAMO2058_000447500 [Amorphochlora amoebiformis]